MSIYGATTWLCGPGGDYTSVSSLSRYLWFELEPHALFVKFDQLILSLGLTLCKVDPTIFQTSTFAGCIILVVYVNDILIIGRDIASITRVKAYLHWHLTI